MSLNPFTETDHSFQILHMILTKYHYCRCNHNHNQIVVRLYINSHLIPSLEISGIRQVFVPTITIKSASTCASNKVSSLNNKYNTKMTNFQVKSHKTSLKNPYFPVIKLKICQLTHSNPYANEKRYNASSIQSVYNTTNKT